MGADFRLMIVDRAVMAAFEVVRSLRRTDGRSQRRLSRRKGCCCRSGASAVQGGISDPRPWPGERFAGPSGRRDGP